MCSTHGGPVTVHTLDLLADMRSTHSGPVTVHTLDLLGAMGEKGVIVEVSYLKTKVATELSSGRRLRTRRESGIRWRRALKSGLGCPSRMD